MKRATWCALRSPRRRWMDLTRCARRRGSQRSDLFRGDGPRTQTGSASYWNDRTFDRPKYKRAVQMLLRMSTPRVTKSRAIVTRKGIPKDVRDEYQRLYGQRWEAKLSLPAGTKDAKVRVSE